MIFKHKTKSMIISINILYIIFNIRKIIKTNQIINFDLLEVKSVDDLINNLNNYSIYREPKYILLFDYFDSPVCEDFNAYIIFEYYKNKSFYDAYYILNEETELYKCLSKENKTTNIIPYKNNQNLNHLFPFLLNSKIIIQSYTDVKFQKIASRVKYIKFLYICHAVNYFKIYTIKYQILNVVKRKQNIILSSPYEYNLFKKLNLYDEKSMHKGGLARYDRLNNIKKNSSEKECILISFTYRAFNNSVYEKSLFKKNR